MTPLLFTLAITFPIIAISVLIWLWVRRSRTPEIETRRRKVFFAVGITACFAVLWYKAFVDSTIYRSMVGISTVAFSNQSGLPLQDLIIVLRSAEGKRFTNDSQLFPSRGTSQLAVRTSELALEYLTCRQGTQHLAHHGGVAIAGEILRVRLHSTGRFTSSK